MKRILIVDDEPFNLDLLSQILEEDYEVIEASNGRKGLEVARAEKPDLILLDMLMPEMSGWEVAAAVRTSEEIDRVPIIAVTALAMSGDEDRAIKAGCNAYLTKPIDDDVLLNKIEALIGK
jgi:two-component system, cell cycle response regulator DivK